MVESQGPDRCRGNLNCREFHGEPVAGLAGRPGANYNCCCCDPCHYIRPVFSGDAGDMPYNYCCRCVPREIYLSFVPDDPDNACCVELSIPMIHERDLDNKVSIYEGEIYDVFVHVELGMDDYGYCYWEAVGYSALTGQELARDYITVDHDQVTCLNVPVEINLPADGPVDCSGALVLEDIPRAKLPFQDRFEPDYWQKFIDLVYEAPPTCGPCTQVCSKVCVDGNRHVAGPEERAEFVWFETDDGTGRRGWFFVPDGIEENTEYLWLEEGPYGDCWIRPDFARGDEEELWDPRQIEACSCGLQEPWWRVYQGDFYRMSVRCGPCSCWDYHCGFCRCMPAELCVVLIVGTTIQRVVLNWDPERHQWGDAGDPIRLMLPPNPKQCVITAEIDGVDEFDQEYRFDCDPPEARTNEFNPAYDFLAFTLEDPAQQIIAVVSGMLPECAHGPCGDATPCNADCGGHPPALTLNLRIWRQVGDVSDPYIPADECSIDVAIAYWETASFNESIGVQWHCGYVGWAQFGEGCAYDWLRVQLSRGVVLFDMYSDGEQVHQQHFTLQHEECDPYLGYYHHDYVFGVPVDPGFLPTCIGCDNYGQFRMEITITE